jgi:ABC-type multidrug transport system fused ATPase/permease subunit
LSNFIRQKKDEATLALDATSHVLMFEAIKRWRAHRTTIVITHDLSQTSFQDVVYVLGMAALDGFFMGLKYFVMETAGAKWVERIRPLVFTKVLAQDKKWFDRTENARTQLVQTLIKDGDNARSLIAVFLSQFCVVIAMAGIGLI